MKKEYDPNSRYYDAGGIETLAIIKAKLGPQGYCDYLQGNTIKYSCRLKHKGQSTRDAEKLSWYSMWLHEALIELNEREED